MSSKHTLQYKEALKLIVALANAGVESTMYTTWTNDFRISSLNETIDKFSSGYQFDPYIFTSTQLDTLGFYKWSDESNLWLAPVYLYPFLTEGTLLTSISGRGVVVGIDEIDRDCRFGCLAYGITPNE